MNVSVLGMGALLVGAHLLLGVVRAVNEGRRARRRDEAQSSSAAPAAPLPGVSIIIPAWNDRGVLPGSVQAALRSAGQYPGDTELIVVAGGPDGTLEAAHRLAQASLSVKVLPQTPHGKNAALNAGLGIARFPVLVLLDADTVVQPGWLSALTAPLRGGDADASTGQFVPSVASAVSRVFEVQQLLNQQIRGAVNLFGGGSIALTRRVLEALPGGQLPEDVLVGVDFDLSMRLRQAGGRLAFCPDARVQTEISSTWGEFWRGELRWQGAYLAARRRHLTREASWRTRLGLLYVPAVYAALLAGWAVGPLMGAALHRPLTMLGLTGLGLWACFAVWVLGRHACACVTAAAYTGHPRRWLAAVPVYMASLCVSAAACWWALLRPRPASAHFKGRRGVPARSSA